MPITSRLAQKANSLPNSGVGSNSAPDATIRLCTGYDNINWTSLTSQEVKTYYQYYLNNSSSISLNSDIYYYNSNNGFNTTSSLHRIILGTSNNPTVPSTGVWVYKYSGQVDIISVTNSRVTAITPYSSSQFSGSSNVTINLCAPTSSVAPMIIYTYAVTGSTPIAVNSPVSASFYWSGSNNQLLSGSLIIPSGSTCTSSSFTFASQSLVSFTLSGSITPFITGSFTYVIGTLTTSNSCASCP